MIGVMRSEVGRNPLSFPEVAITVERCDGLLTVGSGKLLDPMVKLVMRRGAQVFVTKCTQPACFGEQHPI